MFLFLIGCAIGLDPFTFADESGQDPSDLSYVDIDDLTDEGAGGANGAEEDMEDGDLDADGYTVEEGDCDDTDASIHPAAIDDCNGIDNDCDGQTDELGAWDETITNAPLDLGEVPSGYSTTQYALLFPDGDTDSYLFYVADGLFGWFGLSAELVGLSEDADASLRLDLVENASGEAWGEIDYADDGGAGETEYIEFYGRPMYNDSGWYQVTVIAAEGSDCSQAYELVISFTD